MFYCLNYTCQRRHYIGADADNTALVALIVSLPQTSTEEEALTGFELFISKREAIRKSIMHNLIRQHNLLNEINV
ncbi:hypothetical protein KCP74_21270 [Salmonella enterica subsp. enterica]|nr:hypothetical protein KCP74_21270 [Salmonella enterica subsp. enterica]